VTSREATSSVDLPVHEGVDDRLTDSLLDRC